MLRYFRRWFIPEVKRIVTQGHYGVKDYHEVPIVINNFNRYDKLLRLIGGLESRDYRNIWIIDNGSTYPPLLEWYRTCPYKVILLHENIGHLSIFETGLYKKFWSTWYVYTDSDLEIDPNCPDDFMEKFIKMREKYPKAVKAGFSLRIDNLPDCYDKKKEVIEWESQFWKDEIEPGVYNAPIDTTFAVYKPWFKGGLVDFRNMHLRLGPPYSMMHLPWYMDSANPSEEDVWYLSSVKTSTFWSEKDRIQ